MASGMTPEPALLVSLDLAGTFTYALNGGLTAVHAARLDVVGVIALAMVSGLGGGMIRDILLGALPPATFSDWRYLAVAAGGGLAAFALSRPLAKLATVITALDAAGLGLFAELSVQAAQVGLDGVARDVQLAGDARPDRTVAQDVLDEQGEEEEQAEQPGGDAQHDQVGTRPVTVGQDPYREQRPRAAPFDQHERDERHHGRGRDRGARPGPARDPEAHPGPQTTAAR